MPRHTPLLRARTTRAHGLHPRRAVAYGAALIAMKLVVVAAVFAVPTSLLMSEDTFAPFSVALLERTNEVRAQWKQRPLTSHAQLAQSATARANDLARRSYFSHVSPDGRVLEDFIVAAGYQYAVAGENLAMGFSDMERVVETWMASPSHRGNLIATDYDDVGIGIARGAVEGRPVLYVVEHYGRRAQRGEVAVATSTIVAGGSRTTWEDAPDGTAIRVRVATTAPVDRIEADVYGTTIALTRGADGAYTGEAIIPEKPDALFAVSILPSVRAEAGGVVTTATLAWDRVYVPTVRVRTLYALGRAYLSDASPALLVTMRMVFGIALLAFAATTALGMRREMRKQHPRLLGNAALLCGLVILLLVI